MENTSKSLDTILLVANFRSDVGYAWWLMESFWVKLSEHFQGSNRIILAYPRVTRIPGPIMNAPIKCIQYDFSGLSPVRLVSHCQFLRRNRVRTIYLTDRPTWGAAYLLYRLCGVQMIIVHDHTPGNRCHTSGLLQLLKKFVHRIPFLSADGALGASEFVRRRLIEINCLQPEKCFAIPNGLPTVRAHTNAADLHKVFDIPPRRKILVMAARANRYKGIHFILNCIHFLSGKHRNELHFIFIGDGPDLSYFQKVAQFLEIEGNCTFAGRRYDVPALLEGADMAMHPSSGEVGYSLSILEYMRAGLPVIVPDNPSVCGATIHGMTGFIYPGGDVKAAANILAVLIENENLRKEMGEQARSAVGNYSLEETHSRLIAAFEFIERKKRSSKPNFRSLTNI